jgi:hypothetical protein
VHTNPNNPDEPTVYTTVDDEHFEELSGLVGQQIVFAQLWPESVADALGARERGDESSVFDLDLYLRDGVFFELYGVYLYPDLDTEPLAGFAETNQRLTQLLSVGVYLEDVAVDEEEALVLVLGRRRHPQIYLLVGAWSLSDWEELPDHP